MKQNQLFEANEIEYTIYNYETNEKLLVVNSTEKVRRFFGKRMHPEQISNKVLKNGERSRSFRQDGTKCYITSKVKKNETNNKCK